MEISILKLYDVDRERGTLLLHGKGKKDRMVPIGDRALAWMLKYLGEVRPRFATEPDAGWLWLTPAGDNVLPATLGTFISDYVRMSGIGKLGGCHMFRHTMATLMLEGGADVRFIQAMLGHAKLDTTEIYTHVSIRKLKEVHNLTHPAKMEHHPQPGAPELPPVETVLPEEIAVERIPQPDPEQEREELLATLAAEAEDDDLPM
jgi:integrase/recombinase XerD